ncbi:MAG TPA: hypothetical protein VGJ33_18720 [Candidatus Angelobacter sp.]
MNGSRSKNVLAVIDRNQLIGIIASAGTTSLSVVNPATDYNAAGQIKAITYGNGGQGAFTYNDHLQLATLRYYKPRAGSDVLNLSYDYTMGVPGNNGQIQAVHYYTSRGVEDTTSPSTSPMTTGHA